MKVTETHEGNTWSGWQDKKFNRLSQGPTVTVHFKQLFYLINCYLFRFISCCNNVMSHECLSNDRHEWFGFIHSQAFWIAFIYICRNSETNGNRWMCFGVCSPLGLCAILTTGSDKVAAVEESKNQTLQKNSNSLFSPYSVYELQTLVLSSISISFKSNESMLTWKSVSYSFTSCFSFSQQVVGTCKIKILKTFCHTLFSKWIFFFVYKSTTRTAFNVRIPETKEKDAKNNGDQKKLLDILHTWDRPTKNGTNLRVKFSDNLPPTKAKRKDGYTFLHGQNKNVMHTCKFKHRLNETTTSMVPKCAKLKHKRRKRFALKRGRQHFALSARTEIVWGSYVH